jgi:hypothetical protein
VADGVREIHQPILESPLRNIGDQPIAESEVGRPTGLERRLDLFRKLLPRIEAKFGVLAAVLLEGRDDLCDRFVLLGLNALLPPDHEVSGAGAERRQGERRGENRGSDAHIVTSPINGAASICSLPVTGNHRANLVGVSGIREGRLRGPRRAAPYVRERGVRGGYRPLDSDH